MGLFHAAHFYEVNKVIQVQFLLCTLWQNRKNSHFDEIDKNLSFAAVCILKNFLLNLAYFFQVYDLSMKFYQTWPEALRDNTVYTWGWSYIMCWTGLCLTVLASIMFGSSAIALKSVEDETDSDIGDAIINQGYEAAENYEATMRRHGSVATLTSMPLQTVLHHASLHPPGSYVSYPVDDAYQKVLLDAKL